MPWSESSLWTVLCIKFTWPCHYDGAVKNTQPQLQDAIIIELLFRYLFYWRPATKMYLRTALCVFEYVTMKWIDKYHLNSFMNSWMNNYKTKYKKIREKTYFQWVRITTRTTSHGPVNTNRKLLYCDEFSQLARFITRVVSDKAMIQISHKRRGGWATAISPPPTTSPIMANLHPARKGGKSARKGTESRSRGVTLCCNSAAATARIPWLMAYISISEILFILISQFIHPCGKKTESTRNSLQCQNVLHYVASSFTVNCNWDLIIPWWIWYTNESVSKLSYICHKLSWVRIRQLKSHFMKKRRKNTSQR